ncbi:MAG: PilZ domain-containing protein [Rheinheimera sp.]|uniref:PilZ domain-containing protein n=1 Tax=Arsukibacterium sp. UBA3155 TaxID=1946058 RepID=UPI000C8EC5D0|nr:PilZ domain-containing protein [Arsukibacterium sp. UBA3155]MAD75328.1 PilZ domain-containing protein [Rheinheimera sp.]|tara:strand:- start:148605 stop:148970 length:366 start_codon:yes stop_codon:yes gene_type:complete
MEQRRFSRVNFQGKAHLETAEQSYPTDVLDLSLKGALISIPAGWQPDVPGSLILRVHLSDYPLDFSMQVSIAHQHNEVIGLHCDKIDLESAGHLKRLIELNLGDSQILSRELSELSVDEHG